MTEEIHKLSDLRLVIHFNIHEPIKLNELTRSFNAMADLYKTALPKNAKGKTKNEDVELYITEIKDNCILVKLIGILEKTSDLSPDIDQIAIFKKAIKTLSLASALLLLTADVGSVPKTYDSYLKRDTDITLIMAEAIANKGNGSLDIYLEEHEENADGSKRTRIFRMSSDDALKVIEGKKIVNKTLNEHKQIVNKTLNEHKQIVNKTFREHKQITAPEIIKAIPRPSQPTITIKDGFIYYENGNLSVSVETNNIKSMDYVDETSSARIVKIDIDDTNLPCTRQQFDKMIDDIKKAKITNN